MINESILKNTKRLMIILLFVVAFILLLTITSNAAEYTRSFPTNDGSIQLDLTGLTLDEGKQYEYGLTTKGGTPEEWFLITNYTATTATVNISESDYTMRNVLRITDEGYLYIREKDNTESYAVENMQIDLKLPLFYSINVEGNDNGISTDAYGIDNVYNLGTREYKFERITDSTVIEKYLEIKQNDGDIKDLEPYIKTSYPTTGYEGTINGLVGNYNKPEDGLYYMWIKVSSSTANTKTVYSCIIHDGLPNSTSIADYIAGGVVTDSIKATSSHTEYVGSTLEYRAAPGDEIQITVSFTGDINVNEYPTLTIKFGDGENITLTEGEASSDKIIYTYTIQSGDLGTLQIVDFAGGNVTDNDGNTAVITKKDLTGFALVAVESTGNNNSGNNNNGDGNFNITTPTENNQNSAGTGNNNQQIVDNTIATGKIPQTGLEIGMVILITIVVTSAIIGYIKCKNLRDIK